MDVYVFQAALLCDVCGGHVRDGLTRQGRAPVWPEDEETFDSDDFPKGPFPDGGGEADSPQCCDHCGVFLENPLTTVGYAYVHEALLEDESRCISNKTVLGPSALVALWVEFYDILHLPPALYADEMPERDFFEGDSPDY